VKEIHSVAELLGINGRHLSAVFFGGGTASLLPEQSVREILDSLRCHFIIDQQTEKTFEGECMSLQRSDYLEGIAALGFERLSFGVQTTDIGMRKVLNLRPSLDQLRTLAVRAADLFSDVSVDFIYGWPGQTEKSAVDDLLRLLELLPVMSIDAFQFEKLDANPEFMRVLYSAGVDDCACSDLLEIRSSLIEVLRKQSFRKKSYNFFTKRKTRNEKISYGDCYYGFQDGEVVGFGRGSQSIFGGAVWGSAMEFSLWEQQVAQGILAANSYGAYLPGERELVNWPRKGIIPKMRIQPVADSDYWKKLEFLQTNNYIYADDDKFRLTSLGDNWLPRLLEFLMPIHQRQFYHAEMRRFSSLLIKPEHRL
jgi:oxygen-independent coproporphyrinogen-3 oxidase